MFFVKILKLSLGEVRMKYYCECRCGCSNSVAGDWQICDFCKSGIHPSPVNLDFGICVPCSCGGSLVYDRSTKQFSCPPGCINFGKSKLGSNLLE